MIIENRAPNLYFSNPPEWARDLTADTLVIETLVNLDGHDRDFSQQAINQLTSIARQILGSANGLCSKVMFVPPAWGDGRTWLIVGADKDSKSFDLPLKISSR